MFSIKPFMFLLSVLLISSTQSLLSNAHYHGVVDEGEYGVFLRGMKRSVLVLEVNSSNIILAANRTERRDPLDDFNYYKGGWNISELHYFSSVSFTAAPLIVIAAVWFIGFLLCLFSICIYHCCCRRRHYGYSQTAYALSLILLSLFTVAAIVGCIVLYTGQAKFHDSTTHTLNYVVNKADATVSTLRNVSGYLAAAKHIEMGQIFLPSTIQNNIDTINSKINASSYTLENEAAKNKKDIQDVLEAVRCALNIIAAVMLLLALIGFVFSVLGMQFIVNILVLIGWILVAGTFILCGLFLLLHNVAADTCVAMDQWLQQPMAHSALDEILPCVDNATAQETLFQSKDVTYQLVGMVNVFINVSNTNLPYGPLYYNQSGPSVPVLCNPFHPGKTNRKCASSEVNLSNATQVWKKYICQVSKSGNCSSVGRLTPTFYEQMTSAVNVSYALYRYGPFLTGLQDCSFVREAFSNIQKEHCPGLRLYSKWIYIGLALVSTAVMLSLVFWIVYARERRYWIYTKHVMVGAGPSSRVLLGKDRVIS